ncbi:hypothetical protein Q8A67_020065 [Cirrhinus molitorella]|uniref:Uncharacterized protein n=1 Tax=Cirrhinus molitorella TaxID=172907 RepID=A0AA88PC00_9TELE|nr:hypothetical protein Q8A67_020065 [Cirrhinus molitorella]
MSQLYSVPSFDVVKEKVTNCTWTTLRLQWKDTPTGQLGSWSKLGSFLGELDVLLSCALIAARVNSLSLMLRDTHPTTFVSQNLW